MGLAEGECSFLYSYTLFIYRMSVFKLNYKRHNDVAYSCKFQVV